MFALFPYLSIYLQDVLGYTPLGAGLRFLPLTVFVFVVPLSMRKLAPGASLRLVLAGGLALVSRGSAADVRADAELALDCAPARPDRRRGIGIGLANPAIAAAALRAVDPSRTGMASGINNACRLTGVAVGVAALGAILERRISTSLARRSARTARALAAAVSAHRHPSRRRCDPSARPSGHRRLRQRPEHDPPGWRLSWSPSARSPQAS